MDEAEVDLTASRSTIVGIDGSSHALDAVAWAARWAGERDHKLTILFVKPEVLVPKRASVWKAMADPKYLEHAESIYQTKLDKAVEHAKAVDPELEIEPLLIRGGAAARLVEMSPHAKLIVVGTHGAGHAKAFDLGGVADSVVTNAQCPVAVIPSEHAHPEGPVVVGLDDDGRAQQAAEWAFDQARTRGVELVALHAWYTPPATAEVPLDSLIDPEEMTEESERLLDDELTELRRANPDVTVVPQTVQDNPADALIEASKTAGVVVVSSRGRGGFTGLLLGSTSRRLVRNTHAPVIVVR